MSKKINISNNKVGLERRQEMLGEITQNGTYLPKPIDYSDIDKATLDFINNDIDLEISGEEVPVYFMSIQKWTEFTRTWGDSDEFKDVKMPFITIVRDPDIQPGTNQDGLFNIAGFPTFTYHKVPTFNNGREGFDLYKIPQPTTSDLSYNVRFFSNRMSELNKIHNKVQRTFNSLQFYIKVHGHPMPITLESISDESRIDNIESRRYYSINFKMLVSGYILNEDDFEITPMHDRAILFFEGENNGMTKPKLKKKIEKGTGQIDYSILFKKNSASSVKLKITEDSKFIDITSKHNLDDNTQFMLNGEYVSLPFNVKRNDELIINVTKLNDGIATIELVGGLPVDAALNNITEGQEFSTTDSITLKTIIK
jgi:hypothetical protein